MGAFRAELKVNNASIIIISRSSDEAQGFSTIDESDDRMVAK
jgi:hypothetical protein